MVHAGILQAHGVEHAAGGFRHTGRRVAGALLDGDALAGDASQSGQGVKLVVLVAKAKGARGGDEGVLKLHAGYCHFQFILNLFHLTLLVH